MSLNIENALLVSSLMLFFSIIAGKTSFRFGVPVLLFFLAVGMLAGEDGLLGIRFNDPRIAQFIGIVSLNFILFSGGLETEWRSIRPVVWQGISLSTLGVIFTALTLGLFVYWITDFTIYESLLLGSIVSSTDAAAVFSVLRSRNLALKYNLRPTLELESGSNDPMAYVLTIVFLGLVTHPDAPFVSILPLFVQQMAIGGLLGYLFGRLSKWIINSIHLDYEGLYPVLMVSLMFLTFSVTGRLGGNGFLAIYICAVYLGNQELIHKKTILKVYDGFAWLMQIVLFLTLGLLVTPTEVLKFSGLGLLASLFLILVARPAGVLISLAPFRMFLRRRLYISWVGLRGAVPIVFATYPMLAGIDKADLIFNVVFFVSVTSVLIQGTTLPAVARWLHVTIPIEAKPKVTFDEILSEMPKAALREIVIDDNCPVAGKKIVDLAFPHNSLIAVIQRGGKYLTPRGSTEIMAGDRLFVLADKTENLEKIYHCLQITPDTPAEGEKYPPT